MTNLEVLVLAKKAGFCMRPHIEDIHDGIDWSPAGHGYDEVINCFAELVRQDERESIKQEQMELKERVNDLFTKYLDVQEESDSGRMFHPISISCCRAMKLKPLGELIDRLRELSK